MDEVIDRLFPLLEKLADKIGPGAAFSWAVVVRQMYLTAVEYLVWGLAAAAFAVVVGKIALPRVRKAPNADDRVAFTIIVCGVIIGAGIIALHMLTSGVGYLVNPEFYAISWFLRQVR